MAIDPTDLYDENLGPGDNPNPNSAPPPVSSSSLNWSDIFVPASPDQGGNISERQAKDYTGYLPYGLVEGEGRNPELERGEAQSMTDKFGNAAMHTAVKFGTQLVDMAGGLGALLTEWGDNRDYQNGLTDAADQANAWVEKNFPLYRSTEGTLGFTDASWWLQNTAGLAASVGSFAVGGAGVAGLFGAIGKSVGLGARLASGLTQAGMDLGTASKVVGTAEEALTAGTLAYSEGAMSGRVVYNQVYQNQLAQGVDEETARHIAAQSAATTVQLNTVVNTGMNMLGGMGMFFNHEKDAVYNVGRKVLRATEGQTEKEAIESIGRMKAGDFATELGTNMTPTSRIKHILKHGREAVAEGVEEMTNQWAEQVGTEEGKKGKTHGFFEQLSQVENYLKYTMNEEGALNFAMGALAGPVQNAVASHIPMYKVQTGYKKDKDTGMLLDAEGKPVQDARQAAKEYYENGKRVSSAKRNRIITEQGFEDLKTRIVGDLQYLSDKKDELQKATEAGDIQKANEIRDDIFSLMNRNAVQEGMSSNLKESYRSIAALDNTKTDTQELTEKLQVATNNLNKIQAEGGDTTAVQAEITQLQDAVNKSKNKTAAMMLGFASKVGDMSYKKKAENAIKHLDNLQYIYDNNFAKFGMDKDHGRPEEKHVADFIFQLVADKYLTQAALEDARKELNQEDTDAEGSPNVRDLLDQYAGAYRQLRNRARRIRVAARKGIKYNDLLQQLRDADTMPPGLAKDIKVESILNAFGVTSIMEGEAAKGASTKLEDVLVMLKEKAEKEFSDAIQENLDDPDFQEWKKSNPDGAVDKYMEYVGNKLKDSAHQADLADVVAQLEDKVDALDKLHTDSISPKGLEKLMRNSEQFYEKLSKKYEEMIKASQNKRKEHLVSESATQAYNRKVRARLRQTYIDKINKLKDELESVNRELQNLTQELVDNPDKAIYLVDKITLLQEKAALLTQDINVFSKYVKDLENSVVPPPPPSASTPPPPPGTGTPPPPPGAPPPPSGSTAPPPPGAGTPTAGTPPLPPSGPTPPPPPPNPVVIALNEFNQVLSQFSNPGNEAEIGRILGEEKQKGTYSLGALMPIGLTQEESSQVMLAYRNYQQALGNIVQGVADTLSQGQAAMASSPTGDGSIEPLFADYEENYLEPDLSPTVLPDPQKSQKGVVGRKQTSPNNSGASKSTIYLRQRDASGKVSTVSTDQWSNGDTRVVRHDQLLPGTEVTIAVDLSYNRPVKNYNQVAGSNPKAPGEVPIDWTQLINEDGTIKTTRYAVENLPIGITVKGNNTPSQWLHTIPWIEEKDPGATGEDAYFNVGVDVNDPRPVAQVVKEEAEALFKTRLAIIEAYNRGVTEHTTTVIEKNVGSFIYTSQPSKVSAVNLKETTIVQGKAATTMVPLSLVKEGNLEGLENLSRIANVVTGVESYMNNRLVALVRMSNGSRIPIPLAGRLLADTDTVAWQTFNRVTQLYLNSTKPIDQSPYTPEIEQIKAKTGFDVSTRNGYRNFMIQYFTYFNNLDSKAEGIRFSFVNDGIQISLWSKNGAQEKYDILTDDDGNLTKDATKGITKLFANRYRAVAKTNTTEGIKGLNNTEKFVEPVYMPGPDGPEWIYRTYDQGYNEFITSYATTPIQPINMSDGGVFFTDENDIEQQGFFYDANPIIKYDFDKVVRDANSSKPDTTLPTDVISADPTVTDAQGVAASVLSDIFEELPDVTTEVKPEVRELFESNPELADSIYESLGITPLVSTVKALTGNLGENIKERLEDYNDNLPNQIIQLGGGKYAKRERRLISSISGPTQVSMGEEVDYLTETIRKEGQKTPILIHSDGRLIEGRHRLQALKNLNEEYVDTVTLLPNNSQEVRIFEQKKQQAQQLYSQYIEQTGKQDIEGFKEFVSKSQPKAKAVSNSVGTQSRAAESLESLQNLLNFTPQSERNGKTAQEVLDYLRVAQITHLPEGYNPFKRCS